MPKVTQVIGTRARWQPLHPRGQLHERLDGSLNRALRGSRGAEGTGQEKGHSHVRPPIHSHMGEGGRLIFLHGRSLLATFEASSALHGQEIPTFI